MEKTLTPNGEQFGIDELRKAVNLFSNCRESFNQLYSAEDLLKLWRAYRASGWDIPPDSWTVSQVNACLRKGIVPKWDNNENPIEE